MHLHNGSSSETCPRTTSVSWFRAFSLPGRTSLIEAAALRPGERVLDIAFTVTRSSHRHPDGNAPDVAAFRPPR